MLAAVAGCSVDPNVASSQTADELMQPTPPSAAAVNSSPTCGIWVDKIGYQLTGLDSNGKPLAGFQRFIGASADIFLKLRVQGTVSKVGVLVQSFDRSGQPQGWSEVDASSFAGSKDYYSFGHGIGMFGADADSNLGTNFTKIYFFADVVAGPGATTKRIWARNDSGQGTEFQLDGNSILSSDPRNTGKYKFGATPADTAIPKTGFLGGTEHYLNQSSCK